MWQRVAGGEQVPGGQEPGQLHLGHGGQGAMAGLPGWSLPARLSARGSGCVIPPSLAQNCEEDRPFQHRTHSAKRGILQILQKPALFGNVASCPALAPRLACEGW